jgi:iron-sulfur cluster repair protein YtfE (RIC family)
MPHFAQMKNEHAMLFDMALHLEELATGDCPDDFTPIFIELGRFHQLLYIHLLREDAVLYPRYRQSADTGVAATVIRFEDELGHLNTLVEDFEKRWMGTNLCRDWEGFRTDIAQLFDVLRERIARENEELYPLLMVQEEASRT